MPTSLQWERKSNSSNNFDLILKATDHLDSLRFLKLLQLIETETHRGLSLSGRASREFRRWATQPNTPLKSDAYVLLSNWFSTNSGDRRSILASRCEDLWDFLFPYRPVRRLSSPEPGKNHSMLPTEFWNWWNAVLAAQGDKVQLPTIATSPSINIKTREDERDSSPNGPSVQPLTITEAKARLAQTFGVSPDSIEIIIRA